MSSLPGQSESATIATAGARRATLAERIGAAITALACLAVLGVAAWLPPSGNGYGTHTGIGLPDCSWVVMFDRPCMTCGMTTAFSHAAHGQWLDALIVQPAGLLLCLATAVAFWIALHVAAFGSALVGLSGRLLRPRVIWIGVGILLASWAYKLATWQ
jgi:hypothetical protein